MDKLIGHGFIAPKEILSEEHIFGSVSLFDEILVDDGNWKEYLPLGELQKRKGFDTYGCTIYNTLQPIEIVMKKKFGLSQDFSERFVYIGTNTVPPGNNPHIVAEWIRKNGLIQENLLPFNDNIDNLEKYNYPNPLSPGLIQNGKDWVSKYDFGHQWIFQNDLSAKEKNEILKEALRRSPIAVSVKGWQQQNEIYVKEEGDNDNHWTNLIYYDDESYPIILDSYEPFIKKLDKNYDFGYAKKYHVLKKYIISNKEILYKISSYLKNYFKEFTI